MSTTIDVFPRSPEMPFVHATADRARELMQELMEKELGLTGTLEVRPFYVKKTEEEDFRWVPEGTRWEIGMELGFMWAVDRLWVATTWPSCQTRCTIDESDIEWGDYPPEMLGKPYPHYNESLEREFSDEVVEQLNRFDYEWYEYRNFGGSRWHSVIYGFVAYALAEQTNGLLSSSDCGFPDGWELTQWPHEFIEKWATDQLAWYGRDNWMEYITEPVDW